MVNWQAVIALTGVLFFVCSALFGAIKWLIDRNARQLEGRFEKVDDGLDKVEDRFETKIGILEDKMDERERRQDGLKDELKDFKLRVAEEYVPHDDWVRVEGGQNIMLQRISDQISELAVAIGSDEVVARGHEGGAVPGVAQP